MCLEKKCLQIGAGAIAFALFLRLCASGLPAAVKAAISGPEAMAAILYLETGRVIRPVKSEAPNQSAQDAVMQETLKEQQGEVLPALPVFSETDAQLVEVKNVCGYQTDLPALLQRPLSWNLIQNKPTVLILHSHGTESYKKTEEYEESGSFRTLNTDYNVVSVGEELKKVLEAGGVQVIHDTTLHDYPSYSSSYSHARSQIADYLKKYPSIQLVLDIHRDAVENSKGQQVSFSTTIDGQKVGQLMMVVGTDANGLSHPNWPENMALAAKLHAQLEKKYPGICRPISFRSQRFNQDLSSGGMLIEVGAAGNTRQEALRAAKILGQTILELARGTAE